MIVIDDSKPTLPSFQQSTPHIVLDFNQDPPPNFSQYNADFFKLQNGCIISHDPHLNQDGEALYRFLLSQALSPPGYLLHCTGTHDEIQSRTVTSTNKHGRIRQCSETYTETVTDFDFKVDVAHNIPPDSGPVHWSVPDSEPAYRGSMVREVEVAFNQSVVLGKTRRKATRHEIKLLKAWQGERTERGLPPWVTNDSPWQEHGDPMAVDETGGLRSSMTLRNWADEYCASQKHLKEFKYEKLVYGWNIDALKSAIRTIIVSTPYTGNISISFEYTSNKICVQPDNWLSRALSNPWLKFLMFITLIYPFVWLYKRFHPRGGGRWEVGGGAYALKRLVPDDEENPDSKLDRRDRRAGCSSGAEPSKVIGFKEGQWLRQWEGSIKRAVTSRLQTLLTEPDSPDGVALSLDGYAE